MPKLLDCSKGLHLKDIFHETARVPDAPPTDHRTDLRQSTTKQAAFQDSSLHCLQERRSMIMLNSRVQGQEQLEVARRAKVEEANEKTGREPAKKTAEELDSEMADYFDGLPRVFWGAMTALVTSALLFAGSIDSLKSAVVLTSLPFSMILLLMMWGLHKAFYLESQKQIAQLHSLAPVSGSRKGTGGWRQRLSQAVHFPSRDEVYRFLETTVRPAIEEVTAVFVEKGLSVVTQPDPSNDSVSLEIGHGEEHPFVYQVQMRGYFTPSFARGGMGSKQLKDLGVGHWSGRDHQFFVGLSDAGSQGSRQCGEQQNLFHAVSLIENPGRR